MYFYVKHLQMAQVKNVYRSTLKSYFDSLLHKQANMLLVVSFEAEMPLQRFLRSVHAPRKLIFQALWRGLPTSEETFESFQLFFETFLFQNMK